MTTWDAVAFADWLQALGTRETREREAPPQLHFGFAEPNLQFRVSSQSARHVRLHLYFILEQPGGWQMDDAPEQEGDRQLLNYIGEADLTVRHASLRRAAVSLRSDLLRFPVRTPQT